MRLFALLRLAEDRIVESITSQHHGSPYDFQPSLMSEPQDTPAQRAIRPNKSALKRTHQALQKLVAELVEMNPAQLEKLPLDEDLKLGVVQARGMRKNALKRQIRYLSGLLAKRDPLPLQEALTELQGTSRAATVRMHRAEHWRERLLEDGDEAVSALALDYPQVDFQHVRLLLRNILRDQRSGKTPRRYRELYRYLYDLDVGLDAQAP